MMRCLRKACVRLLPGLVLGTIGCLACVLLQSCRNVGDYRREADETAARYLAAYQTGVTGTNGVLSVERWADTL